MVATVSVYSLGVCDGCGLESERQPGSHMDRPAAWTLLIVHAPGVFPETCIVCPECAAKLPVLSRKAAPVALRPIHGD